MFYQRTYLHLIRSFYEKNEWERYGIKSRQYIAEKF